MSGGVFLAGAILLEITATLSLRAAVHGSKSWYGVVGIGYIAAFWMLSLTLQSGIPLGVAYGIWAAVGVALTAVASNIIFKEPLTWIMAAGIALIMGGVLLIEVGVGAG